MTPYIFAVVGGAVMVFWMGGSIAAERCLRRQGVRARLRPLFLGYPNHTFAEASRSQRGLHRVGSPFARYRRADLTADRDWIPIRSAFLPVDAPD
jgi:hypothetical protein